MKEIPKLGIRPQNLTLFQLNHTKVRSLEAMDFYGHTVETMVIESNTLASIDPLAFTGLQGLKYLKIKANKLKYSNGDDESDSNYFLLFSELGELKTLVLEDNRLNFTTMGQGGAVEYFMKLPCLEYLSLKGNPITMLHKNVFAPFSCAPIVELHLRNCELQFIHSGQTSIFEMGFLGYYVAPEFVYYLNYFQLEEQQNVLSCSTQEVRSLVNWSYR